MVGVASNIFKIVVLAASANALLRVNGAFVIARATTKKHILELIHTRVGEEQGWIVVRHNRTRRHNGVTGMLCEIIQKCFSNVGGALHQAILEICGYPAWHDAPQFQATLYRRQLENERHA